MPTFVFTDPSGKTHEVSGPPGATPEQAFSILQRQLGQSRPQAAPMKVDPTEGMSYGQKALANLGAGIDSAWQGAKQLVGQGMTDEELREKRRIDAQLADATTGGTLMQIAGEVLPTVPIGMGAGALAKGAGGIAAAMARSPTLAGMGGGALSGAIMPTTEDESRLANMGLAAAGGGAAPHVLKGALKGIRGVGGAADRIVSALPSAMGERAAHRVAAKRTAEQLTREFPQGLPADKYTPHPHIYGPASGADVVPSAAVTTQDPMMAALERASRTADGPSWQGYDEAIANARWKALDEGLQTGDDIAASRARADAIGAQAPYKAAGPKAFNRAMDDFYDSLQEAKQTAAYHGNPAVKSAVDYVENTMESAGTVTPELMHRMRSTIGKGLTGVPGAGEAGVRAASSEPFVIGLSKAMDDVLETATKGKWGRWKGDYADEMMRGEGAKADVNIRGRFIDEGTGMPRKPVSGLADTPVITGAALKQAIAAQTMKRGPKKGQSALRTGSEDILQGVRNDLDMQGTLQRSKGASTGGSGSDTASNLTQAALMELVLPTGLGIGRYVQAEGKRKIGKVGNEQLARLLQNPKRLREFLRLQEQQRLLRQRVPNVPGLPYAAGPLLLGGPSE